MRDAFIKRLTQLAERDERIMLITGDLGFAVFDNYRRRCPNQFLNVGVAEQNMIGVATGMALEGHVVFTYSIANFAFMRCLEQIRNDAAYHHCNVNVVAVGGGLSYGQLGISHHATEDLAIMRSLPEMTVVAPGDEWEAAEATEAVTRESGTCYLRLDRVGAATLPESLERFALGQIRTLRDGADITLAATGGIVCEVLRAADLLAEQGVHARVLSVHTLKPLDGDTICRSAIETGGIVTVEEHTVDGGLGGAIAELLLERQAIPAVFRRIGLRAGFSGLVGSQDFLRACYRLDAVSIVHTVNEALQCGSRPLQPLA
jgi:transketolase